MWIEIGVYVWLFLPDLLISSYVTPIKNSIPGRLVSRDEPGQARAGFIPWQSGYGYLSGPFERNGGHV